MSTVVVGGHSRNIGKTALAAGIVAAFPDLGWFAVKITQYGHGVCSINGRACGCAAEEHSYAVMEETSRDGRTDSSRFLAAGARRALWVRTKQGQLRRAMPELWPFLSSEPFVIIESNSILDHIRPDLYLVVLEFGNPDFKESARRFLNRADAVVIVGETEPGAAGWDWWQPGSLDGIERFHARPPDYVSPELRRFVESRLQKHQAGT